MTAIEQEIPFEEYRNKQLRLPFIEELDKILSVYPEMVEFIVRPNDDMVDVQIGWEIFYVITKRQYRLLIDNDPSLDKNLNKDDDDKANSL